MDHYHQNLLSGSTGLPVVGATVTVNLASTSTLAPLYQTNSVEAPTFPNPGIWDGVFAAYIPDGRYDITVLEGGRTTTRADVSIIDEFLFAATVDEVRADLAIIAPYAGELALVGDDLALGPDSVVRQVGDDLADPDGLIVSITTSVEQVNIALTSITALLAGLGYLSPPYNANDIGYDIVLKIGQSNESGYGVTGYNAAIDNIPHPRVLMQNSAGAIVPAGIPIHEVSGPGVLAPNYGFELAKMVANKTPTNRTIVLCPCSQGSTGFNTYWDAGNPGGTGYENAIAKANAIIALDPTKNRLAWIEWIGGEANTGTATATYAAWWDAMVAGLRSRITGATNCPVIIGQMVPEVYADNGDTVDLAHQQSPARLQYVGFWPGTRGNSGVDATYHYDAATTRANVPRAYEALIRARGNVATIIPSAPPNFTVASESLGAVTFSWKRPNERITSWKLRYRRKSVGGTFTTVSIPAEANGYVLGGLYELAGSAVYEGQLLGVNESGDGIATALLDFAPAVSSPYILDQIAVTAGRAYSLVKLRAAYAGNCIKVRRSSDDTLLDIGFTAGGMVDIAALLAFVGSGSGYIQTWYDQSGGARNYTQATNANQPRVVNAGVLVTQNGRPAIEYYQNGVTGVQLVATAGGPVASDFTLSFAGTVSPNANQYVLSHDPYGNNGGYELRWGNRIIFKFYNQGDAATDAIITKEVPISLSVVFDNTTKATPTLYVADVVKPFTVITAAFSTSSPAVAGGQTGAAAGAHTLQYVGKEFEEFLLAAKLSSVQALAVAAYRATMFGTGSL